VSWQLGVTAVLFVALISGFVWYERSRPPSRIIALVAVLASLAVAGRVALAPVPNVVATTDIALLAGYTLGGAPGFVVGALAALVSNFWLGQGPWTLWQMIAWGAVGIGGALLARLTARRLGRVGLAVAAAIAGLAYGAFLDYSVMVNFGGEQSLDRYLALSARGIPFNVAHAVGNAAFMLVAGPALVAMLNRFRARSEIEWAEGESGDPGRSSGPALSPPVVASRASRLPGAGTVGVALVTVVALAATIAVSADAASTSAEGPPTGANAASTIAEGSAAGANAASTRAERWLRGAQNADGGFGATPGQPSDPAMTGWAALGLEAVEVNPLDVGAAAENPIGYLKAANDQLRSTGDLERTMLALAGAGVNPTRLSGRDMLGGLEDRRRENGSWEGQIGLTAFGILALRAAGRSASKVRESSRWLVAAANDDGGWGSRAGSLSESDSTGAVLQALANAPGKAAARAAQGGVGYLNGAQESDGGWALTQGAGSNSQSTAWAVQGLDAAGADPKRVRNEGRSGLDYLAARQASDGHYRYAKGSDQTPVWVTAQALLAVERQSLPIPPVARAVVDPDTKPASQNDRAPSSEPSGKSSSGDGAAGQGGKETRRDPASTTESEPPGERDQPRSAAADLAARPPGAVVPATAGARNNQLRWIGLGAIALVAIALGGGFLVYRRRLP